MTAVTATTLTAMAVTSPAAATAIGSASAATIVAEPTARPPRTRPRDTALDEAAGRHQDCRLGRGRRTSPEPPLWTRLRDAAGAATLDEVARRWRGRRSGRGDNGHGGNDLCRRIHDLICVICHHFYRHCHGFAYLLVNKSIYMSLGLIC